MRSTLPAIRAPAGFQVIRTRRTLCAAETAISRKAGPGRLVRARPKLLPSPRVQLRRSKSRTLQSCCNRLAFPAQCFGQPGHSAMALRILIQGLPERVLGDLQLALIERHASQDLRDGTWVGGRLGVTQSALRVNCRLQRTQRFVDFPCGKRNLAIQLESRGLQRL